METSTAENNNLNGTSGPRSRNDSVNLAGTLDWSISAARCNLATVAPTPQRIVWPDGSKLIRREA